MSDFDRVRKYLHACGGTPKGKIPRKVREAAERLAMRAPKSVELSPYLKVLLLGPTTGARKCQRKLSRKKRAS